MAIPNDRATNMLLDEIRSLERKNSELQLALIAGTGGHFMAKPVQFEVHWPEGVPHAFKDAEEIQAWARKELAKLRGQEEEQKTGLSSNIKMRAKVKNGE